MRPDAERPLAVDLDGTLIHSDLLFEGANAYVTRTPFGVFNLARWVAAGRDRVKVELASRSAIEPAALPYRAELLDWLREEHRAGRELVLVSASDERQVKAVADHLGIFQASFGTRPGLNLKAHAKHDLLVDQFGAGGYDYVGDHKPTSPYGPMPTPRMWSPLCRPGRQDLHRRKHLPAGRGKLGRVASSCDASASVGQEPSDCGSSSERPTDR
ncbi:MAG: hypothetical protein ACJ71Z_02400 [Aeromicrobium sp.]